MYGENDNDRSFNYQEHIPKNIAGNIPVMLCTRK